MIGVMTPFDIIVSVTSVVLAGATVAYAAYLGRVSGRDRPHDPERLRRFIENAPYEQPGPSGRKARCSNPLPEK
ncbi:hypothetical protein AB9K35_22015 [Leisingera sp. XS_AS12]|uniref:hypothetical protein n=1 Tax=Leisingera sp. XS_AS12 TaxID=3241294 RepID=UPI003512AB28